MGDKYLVVYKLKNSNMESKVYYCESKAMGKYNSMANSKPKPISISIYYKGKLLHFDGTGSHFKK